MERIYPLAQIATAINTRLYLKTCPLSGALSAGEKQSLVAPWRGTPLLFTLLFLSLLPLMPFTKNEQGEYVYRPPSSREPGLEGLAGSAVFAPDLNLDGNSLGIDGTFEYGLGGAATAAIYSGLMKFLELEPLVKIGSMSRRQQLAEVRAAAWKFSKDKAVWVILIAAVCAFLPGLVPVLSILGFVGLGTMSYRLVRAFYSALSAEQLNDLRASAAAAGIDLQVPEQETKATAAGGEESFDEPLPQPAGA